MGTRLLDGRCLVTVLSIKRLIRFLPLELGRCLVTFRSLERLVILFGAASFFDYVVMFLLLEIVYCLVMFCPLYCWVTFIYVELGSHLVPFCSRMV
mgnify:CR=1 FL=1